MRWLPWLPAWFLVDEAHCLGVQGLMVELVVLMELMEPPTGRGRLGGTPLRRLLLPPVLLLPASPSPAAPSSSQSRLNQSSHPICGTPIIIIIIIIRASVSLMLQLGLDQFANFNPCKEIQFSKDLVQIAHVT